MARISDITVKEQPAFGFVYIRKTIQFLKEFGDFSAQSFSHILARLDGLGILVSDGPIVCFHNMDLERLDVSVGFPVARVVEPAGEMQTKIIPAQKVVTAIDQGAYEEQDPTLEDLFSWMQAHDVKPLGEIYYQYLNDTNRPSREYLTKMILPIQ